MGQRCQCLGLSLLAATSGQISDGTIPANLKQLRGIRKGPEAVRNGGSWSPKHPGLVYTGHVIQSASYGSVNGAILLTVNMAHVPGIGRKMPLFFSFQSHLRKGQAVANLGETEDALQEFLFFLALESGNWTAKSEAERLLLNLFSRIPANAQENLPDILQLLSHHPRWKGDLSNPVGSSGFLHSLQYLLKVRFCLVVCVEEALESLPFFGIVYALSKKTSHVGGQASHSFSSLFFAQGKVDQDENISVQEEQKITENLWKSTQRRSLDENGSGASAEESHLPISEKCRLLKRRHCSEDGPDTGPPSKILKRGKLNFPSF
uniref:Uncharacterized protein n=1 Tax=Anolis carolinensis TaxID=28377 RepID=A0A803T7H8_ANOCA